MRMAGADTETTVNTFAGPSEGPFEMTCRFRTAVAAETGTSCIGRCIRPYLAHKTMLVFVR